MGLVAPWHVGSSRTRARTRVPCIGRRILNHSATREAPNVILITTLSGRYKYYPHITNMGYEAKRDGMICPRFQSW